MATYPRATATLFRGRANPTSWDSVLDGNDEHNTMFPSLDIDRMLEPQAFTSTGRERTGRGSRRAHAEEEVYVGRQEPRVHLWKGPPAELR
jgi:hypothetical protein